MVWSGTEKPQTDTLLMLALERNGSYETVEPIIFKVEGVTQKNVTLVRQQTFMRSRVFCKSASIA